MKTKARQNRRVAETHGLLGESRDEAGTLSAEPWFIDYRIGYYLSSEKLRAMNGMSCGARSAFHFGTRFVGLLTERVSRGEERWRGSAGRGRVRRHWVKGSWF